MTVLYINNEHCTSLEQLRGYFLENLTSDSDIYADLLDNGRYGDIAKWLDEHGEPELSAKVNSIPDNLSDSAFYYQLKTIITGAMPDALETDSMKPAFDKCFSFESLKCDVKKTEARVRVSLKVLMCVNEEYELRVISNWGTRVMIINPYDYMEGKSVSYDYTFHKRHGKDIGEITVLSDGKELSRTSKFGREYDEITVDGISFRMIRIGVGSFDMDTNYHVTLRNYSIGETQVTQELWEKVMGYNPSSFKGAQNPVECVSWHDCKTFIRKLNELTGKYFRLPTKAEWEFAARGGVKSTGYKYSGSNSIDEVAWYIKNSNSMPHPVKEKKPNEFGIYDMIGNVWEWCQDHPKVSTFAPCCVILGGSYDDYFHFHIPSDYYYLDGKRCNLGFRIALETTFE